MNKNTNMVTGNQYTQEEKVITDKTMFFLKHVKTCRCRQELGLHRFIEVAVLSKGEPCISGCYFFNKGTCDGYLQLRKAQEDLIPRTKKKPLFTNAQIASELGISKRQVAKMRKENKLPDKFKE